VWGEALKNVMNFKTARRVGIVVVVEDDDYDSS
jgi:hypothetical protein